MLRTGYRQRIIYRSEKKIWQLLFLIPLFVATSVLSFFQFVGRNTYKFFFFSVRKIICLVQLILKKISIIFAGLSFLTLSWLKLVKLMGHQLLAFKFNLALPQLPSLPKISFHLPSLHFRYRRRLRWTAILILAGIFSVGLAFYFFILKDLPNPNQLITRDQVIATKIYDRN